MMSHPLKTRFKVAHHLLIHHQMMKMITILMIVVLLPPKKRRMTEIVSMKKIHHRIKDQIKMKPEICQDRHPSDLIFLTILGIDHFLAPLHQSIMVPPLHNQDLDLIQESGGPMQILSKNKNQIHLTH